MTAKFIFYMLLLCFSTLSFADPLKKAELLPGQEKAMVPGTKVPLERMNTAPTQPELQEEDIENRTILNAREEKERELKSESHIRAKSKKATP